MKGTQIGSSSRKRQEQDMEEKDVHKSSSQRESEEQVTDMNALQHVSFVEEGFYWWFPYCSHNWDYRRGHALHFMGLSMWVGQWTLVFQEISREAELPTPTLCVLLWKPVSAVSCFFTVHKVSNYFLTVRWAWISAQGLIPWPFWTPLCSLTMNAGVMQTTRCCSHTLCLWKH